MLARLSLHLSYYAMVFVAFKPEEAAEADKKKQ